MVQRTRVQVNVQMPFRHISGEGKGCCPEQKLSPYTIPKDRNVEAEGAKPLGQSRGNWTIISVAIRTVMGTAEMESRQGPGGI